MNRDPLSETVDGLPGEAVPAPLPGDEVEALSRSATPAESPAPEAALEESPPHVHGQFARRVAAVFTTQVSLFAIALVNSILLSRILGPEDKGSYAAIVTLPTMLSSFGTLGLPSAANYFAGKGVSLKSLTRAALILTVVVSAILVGLVWIVLPELEKSILSAARAYDNLLRAIVLIVPLSILSAFGGSILYGRQAVRVYNLIQLAAAAFLLVAVVAVVAVARGGVAGAVACSVATAILTVLLVMGAVYSLARSDRRGDPVSYRGLASYGARSYPASLSGYFSYRADTYIIQASLASQDPTGPLGLYTQAVTMDELVFYVPNSIATLFLPRVAGSTHEDSSRMVARVGRLTTLLTLCVVVALIPVAFLGIYVILPRFTGCLPAFAALLPGMVTLSIGKVMMSYIGGRGRPGLVAVGSTIALAVNVALNLVFIPAFGIVGASLASDVSYTIQAGVAVYFAARLSGNSVLALTVPGREEVRLAATTLARLFLGLPVAERLASRRSAP
jgi:O-antigen/teichoic acid export membrane protein